jgi:hypothetical protein
MGGLSAVLSDLPLVFQRKTVLNLFNLGLTKPVGFTGLPVVNHYQCITVF